MVLLKSKKVLLRHDIKERLQSLSQSKKTKIENKLYEHLFKSKIWSAASTIGMTCSQSMEWNTFPIIERAWKEKKRVAVPKSNPQKRELVFYYITSKNELELGHYGILEPGKQTVIAKKNEIDLLLVPGLVFDLFGYRIGFGGGYYDRYLNDFKQETVSLASQLQIIERIPSEPYDIRVRHLVHEHGCVEVNAI